MSLRFRFAIGIALATWGLLLGAGVLFESVLASVAQRHFETTFDDSMKDFAFAFMDTGGRARCEADPGRFAFDGFRPPPRPGAPPPPNTIRVEPPADRAMSAGSPPPQPPPPPPPEDPPDDGVDARKPPPPGGRDTRIWAYRADFTSMNPRAPALPKDLIDALEAGRSSASHAAQIPSPPDASPRDRTSVAGREMLLRTAAASGPCAVLLVQRAGAEPPPPPFPKTTYLVAGAGFASALAIYGFLLAWPTIRRIRTLAREVRTSAASQYRQPVTVPGKDEIADLAREFNEAGRDVRAHIELLEAREKTLRDFVSNTAHDVAIPLTVLQGHLAGLRESAAAGRAPDRAQLREAIEEAHYIGCILANLSAAAKLEASPAGLARNPVDLNALVERVISRHRPVAQAAGVSLEYAVPLDTLWAPGDVTLLEQAVSNLVHNAIRYHREEGHVAVVLDATFDGRFTLRVVDDGPGIPDDEMPRVLERSFRGRDARTRAPHGAGLGLHIANDVVKRHGFSLRLARSEAGGLEATLSGVGETRSAAEHEV